MASEDKQARRRRIMERGNDRMALITGQIRTLGASPSLPSTSATASTYQPPRHLHSESSPSIVWSQLDHHQPEIQAIPEDADNSIGSKLLDMRNEVPSVKNFDHRNLQAEPQLRKTNTSSETARDPAIDAITTVQTHEVKPSVERVSHKSNFFSSKQINSCIIASERTRSICSLTIACIVLVPYIVSPLIGINIVSSGSMIASRPIYTILLTDITVVLIRLFREMGNDSEGGGCEGMEPVEDAANWGGAVKLLERGLTSYQAIRGIFIDCSIYLVVVICGFSLLLTQD